MGKLFCMFLSKRFENILGKMGTNSGSIVLHSSKQQVCTYSDVGGCFLFVVELLNEHWYTKTHIIISNFAKNKSVCTVFNIEVTVYRTSG